LCVIDHAEQWALIGRFGHQGEHRQSDEEPVSHVTSDETEGCAEGVALRRGQSLQAI
jgi:hypothetical protein